MIVCEMCSSEFKHIRLNPKGVAKRYCKECAAIRTTEKSREWYRRNRGCIPWEKQRYIKKQLKCKKCKETFEHITKEHSEKKQYCDYCICLKNRELSKRWRNENKRLYSHV